MFWSLGYAPTHLKVISFTAELRKKHATQRQGHLWHFACGTRVIQMVVEQSVRNVTVYCHLSTPRTCASCLHRWRSDLSLFPQWSEWNLLSKSSLQTENSDHDAARSQNGTLQDDSFCILTETINSVIFCWCYIHERMCAVAWTMCTVTCMICLEKCMNEQDIFEWILQHLLTF